MLFFFGEKNLLEDPLLPSLCKGEQSAFFGNEPKKSILSSEDRKHLLFMIIVVARYGMPLWMLFDLRAWCY